MMNSTEQSSNQMSAAANRDNSHSFKENTYLVFNGVSNAILVCLGVGLLLSAMSNWIHWPALGKIGLIAQWLMAPAIGAGVASQLRTNTLVLFSSMVASTIGANNVYFTSDAVQAITATGHLLNQPANSGVFMIGQPISAVGGAVVATLIGKYLTGKTPLDMFLVPFAVTSVGSIIALGMAAITTPILVWLSGAIAKSMQVNPFLGSLVIAVVWAIFMMTPASSAALAIAIMLDPLSSGAALMGTTAQFVSYTVMSFKENQAGSNIAQGLITPKVQFGNIIKNPWISIPGLVCAGITGVIGTVFFQFSVPYTIAGMGLNSLVAPLALASTNMVTFGMYIAVGVILPAVISFAFGKLLRATKRIKKEDMKIDLV